MLYFKFYLNDRIDIEPTYQCGSDNFTAFSKAVRYWRTKYDLSNDDLISWSDFEVTKKEYEDAYKTRN
jgi:hypothetical protein